MASLKGDPIIREFSDIDSLSKSRNRLESALHKAIKEGQPQVIINGIRKELADYFYSKHEYEDATKHYIDTIGFLEPSYVINQFIDAKLAEYLLQYLTALSSGNSNEEMYTSLRLNCLICLRKSGEIQALVNKALNNETIDYDINAAVSSLNRENYSHFAIQLAEKFDLHKEHLAILAQKGEYSKMVDVLMNVTSSSPGISELILNYGPIILRSVGDTNTKMKFTDFIADYSVKAKHGKAKLYFGIFAEYPELQLSFLKKILESSPESMSKELWDILIPLYIQKSPNRLYEDVINHKKANYSTDCAVFSLKNAMQKNPELSSVLKPSLHAIYEKRELFRDILNDSEHKDVPKICSQYINKDPTIWREGISILSKAKAKEPLQQLVDYLLQNNIAPLNSVIAILEKTRENSFGLIKKYAQNIASKLQQSVDSLQEELDILDKKIDAGVDFQRQINDDCFIVRPSKCGACNIHVDVPSLHFPCGHSFHSGCIKGPFKGCSKCQEMHEANAKKKLELFNYEKKSLNLLHDIESVDHYYTLFQDLITNGLLVQNPSSSETEDIQELLAKLNGEVQQ